jgi:hypothetical protein
MYRFEEELALLAASYHLSPTTRAVYAQLVSHDLSYHLEDPDNTLLTQQSLLTLTGIPPEQLDAALTELTNLDLISHHVVQTGYRQKAEACIVEVLDDHQTLRANAGLPFPATYLFAPAAEAEGFLGSVYDTYHSGHACWEYSFQAAKKFKSYYLLPNTTSIWKFQRGVETVYLATLKGFVGYHEIPANTLGCHFGDHTPLDQILDLGGHNFPYADLYPIAGYGNLRIPEPSILSSKWPISTDSLE